MDQVGQAFCDFCGVGWDVVGEKIIFITLC